MQFLALSAILNLILLSCRVYTYIHTYTGWLLMVVPTFYHRNMNYRRICISNIIILQITKSCSYGKKWVQPLSITLCIHKYRHPCIIFVPFKFFRNQRLKKTPDTDFCENWRIFEILIRYIRSAIENFENLSSDS
jgi:hypothetical protein